MNNPVNVVVDNNGVEILPIQYISIHIRTCVCVCACVCTCVCVCVFSSHLYTIGDISCIHLKAYELQ